MPHPNGNIKTPFLNNFILHFLDDCTQILYKSPSLELQCHEIVAVNLPNECNALAVNSLHAFLRDMYNTMSLGKTGKINGHLKPLLVSLQKGLWGHP